ncbi:MAG: methylenetetrahydrofolate dehydrogenase (NADP+) / methenyltetrahydrofolate cyclohydrolase [Parcubacteria group bacterium LiPW_39]|nr:MAG: methylenetetrahydrofolate dehydrogenase (NADP+) / methenyltetrahydrofolate cyclohydrolase [Parcubacteria group bacterium LiPW_39]
MKIFDGKKAAQRILKELSSQIKKKKIRPVLAAISVGEEEASMLYVKLKKEAGKKVGIEVRDFNFSSQAKEKEIIAKIKELDEDKKIHGIIIQLPLPAVFNTERIIEAISPTKDIDGFHKENRRLLEKEKEPNFMPVLPLAILWAMSEAVKNNLQNLKDKNILALVNSEIFGQVLKSVLKKEGLFLKYQARNTCLILGLEKEMQNADVLISVCGCPNLIKGAMIKNGVILIDAGITRYHDGRVVGDVDRKDAQAKAAFLTPVPGGIGPLTVALLLRNVYLATAK